jgi:hypothetical protein
MVPLGADVAHRFRVYRNNVISGLVNALGDRFPVSKRLVGDAFFDTMARVYVGMNLPRSPLLFRYGDSFPSFIAEFEPADPVPFLADLAHFEFLRGEAFHAADASAVPAAMLKQLSADALQRTSLLLHPSVRLLCSTHPVVTIWRAHQDDGDPQVARWQAEDALIARPHSSVEVHVLPPGGHAFLAEVRQGSSMSRAATRAVRADPRFDPGEVLGLLLRSQLIVGIKAVVPR